MTAYLPRAAATHRPPIRTLSKTGTSIALTPSGGPRRERRFALSRRPVHGVLIEHRDDALPEQLDRAENVLLVDDHGQGREDDLVGTDGLVHPNHLGDLLRGADHAAPAPEPGHQVLRRRFGDANRPLFRELRRPGDRIEPPIEVLEELPRARPAVVPAGLVPVLQAEHVGGDGDVVVHVLAHRTRAPPDRVLVVADVVGHLGRRARREAERAQPELAPLGEGGGTRARDPERRSGVRRTPWRVPALPGAPTPSPPWT